MAALGIAGFGIQKRSELLARHSGKGRVSASETVGKHHELTRELRCFSNTFVQYQVHHISLFELIRFILSKDFPGGHFKKFKFFLTSARIWRAGGACWECEREQKAGGGRPCPDHFQREGAPAPWILGPLGLTDAVCLWLFLNLVNDHASRLVGCERLRVIAVARMHPHA